MVATLNAPMETCPKGIIRFRVCPFFINPCRLAPLDATTGIFLSPLEVWITVASPRKQFSSSNASTSSVFKFIRHKIAALGIRTHLQGILHIEEVLPPHGVPERPPVIVRCPARLFPPHPGWLLGLLVMGSEVGLFSSASMAACRPGARSPSQDPPLLFPSFIGGGVLCGKQPVLAALAVEELLCRLPCLCPFFPQF